jgi:hypothetical protein
MIPAIVLAGAGLLSLIVVWFVEGLFKRVAPFGDAADYLIGLVAGVGVAALDYWFLIPMFLGQDVAGWLRVGGSILEGAVAAWFILWVIRLAVRPPMKADRSR